MTAELSDASARRASVRRLFVAFLAVSVASGVWYWTLFFVDASRRDDQADRICQQRITSGEVRRNDLDGCLRAERKTIRAESAFFPYYLGPVILGVGGMMLLAVAFVRARPLMRNRNDGTVGDR